VYDLGGGTFDISILEVKGGVFQVKSTAGDTFLGGEDFDARIIDYLLEEFEKKEGIDLSGDKAAMQRLKEESEKAKITLSSAAQTTISLPFIAMKDSKPVNLKISLSQAKFESLVKDLIERTMEPVKAALKDAGLKPSDIDKVLMVGGMTRVPKVNETVAALFGEDKMEKRVNPDEVVCTGAAIQAGILTGEIDHVVLLDVTPLSIGIRTLGDVMSDMIPRNTTIPAEHEEVFTTAKDDQQSVHISVFQGERAETKYNKPLGEFSLEKILPAKKGVPQIKVIFNVNADGILSVTATDLATGNEKEITIEASGGLTDEQVEDMLKDAEANAETDQELRDMITAKNIAEATINTTKELLETYGDNLPADEKATVETLLVELEACVADEDSSSQVIVEKVDELQTANREAGTAMYEQAAEKAAAEAETIDVEEVDAEEVDAEEVDAEVVVEEDDDDLQPPFVAPTDSGPNPSP